MNHNAIYALYPNVVSINDTTGPIDKDGKPVAVNMSDVNAWVDPNQYKYDRQQAYKPLAEQLDMQYWDSVNGTDTWKQHIDAVKTAHPKPTE